MTKNSYCAEEILALNVPGYPKSVYRMRGRLDREAGEPIMVHCQGGNRGMRKEYAFRLLRPLLQNALIHADLTIPPPDHNSHAHPALALNPSPPCAASSSFFAAAQASAADVPPQEGAGGFLTPAPAAGTPDLARATTQLKSWQRDVMLARKGVLDAIARMAANGSGCERRAIRALIDGYKAGTLREEIAERLRAANARCGKYRVIERATVARWKKLYAKDGIAGLAPKSMERWEIPAWGAALLAIWQQPQKPSLAFAVNELAKQLPEGAKPPSYTTVRRFLTRMGAIERETGRRLPREMKNLRPFVRRDVSEMFPCDVYTADGHTFDAEIAHPIHGQPFRPEVTGVKDVVTRRIEGWSAGLAESTWTVADAWRNAVEVGGVNALFYVDLGSGFNSKVIAGPVLGIEERLGATVTNSLPYNSQARGQIENSHKLWITLAKTFATYMGADMDPEAKKRAFKITRRDVAAVGKSRLLPTWPEFLAACQKAVNAYNARPQMGLPKMRDAKTGRMRRMSPNEMREKFLAEGWEPLRLSAEESADLFRPYRECIVLRGEVRLFNNTYFAKALAEYHRERVRVGYDIHDASRVWVRDQAERLICVAEFEANKKAYFPQSFIEQAVEKRSKAAVRRLETHLATARAEVDPQELIEQQAPGFHLPTLTLPARVPQSVERPMPKPVEFSAADQACMAEIEAECYGTAQQPRKVPEDIDGKYAWHVKLALAAERGESIPQDLQHFFATYDKTDEYRSVASMYADFKWSKERIAKDARGLELDDPGARQSAAA